MELTQVQSEVPLLQPATPRSNFSCFHWLSVCSFALLLVATTVFALLHFQIIPTPGKQEEFQVPEVFHIKTFLDSAPHAQAMTGRRLAAHLTGKLNGDKIVWEFTPMNTFKTPDLKLKDNSLEIPQDGLYFVYTQVVYTGRECEKVKSTELTHTVNRKGEYGKVTPLLTSTKTACEVASKNIWHQPIYQGGIFQLEEGDILSTETTHIHLLNLNKGQVYFGVLAL
ncbi:tumor necrosis factor-like [Pyxicephalus adspersus]|uniref:tumor necrosis factor-like n=1 Tax=Pyxicephalus adspersus TaxID=30357 RepID=UPI003B58CC07